MAAYGRGPAPPPTPAAPSLLVRVAVVPVALFALSCAMDGINAIMIEG